MTAAGALVGACFCDKFRFGFAIFVSECAWVLGAWKEVTSVFFLGKTRVENVNVKINTDCLATQIRVTSCEAAIRRKKSHH